MDIIGTYGYAGQPLMYLDGDKFCYISGVGVVIIDASGPKDVLWRHDNGINAIASHVLQKWLAIAPKTCGLPIEIIDVNTQRTLFSLKPPSTNSVISMAFSKDGAKLVVLTDITDHRLVLYNVGLREILHSFSLEENITEIHFNPGNANVIALSSYDSVSIGVYTEMLGVYDFRTHKLDIIPDADDSSETSSLLDESFAAKRALPVMKVDHSEVRGLSFNNPVSFVCWASLETLLIGLGQGYYFDVNYLKKSSIVIGNGHPGRGEAPPAAAVLTADYLIVGATDGTVKWFLKKLIGAFITRANSQTPLEPSLFKPIKIVKLQRGQNSLASLKYMIVNPMYSSIVAAAMDGTIHNFKIEPSEQIREEEDTAEIDDPIAALISSLPASPDTSAEEPFIDYQTGVVLCTKSLYIQVMQTQDGVPINEYSGSLSLLITGGHTGTVMFWRSPVPAEADISHNATGIRKSTPRKPRAMFRLEATRCEEKIPTAVCQLEILSTVCKHGGRLLGIGTSDGWFEIWMIEAFESEDEDGEGDEEEGLFYIKVTKVMRRHMFNEPISLICSSDTKPFVAVGSSSSHNLYILSFQSTHQIAHISQSFSIAGESIDATVIGFPKCCCWQKSNLWILTENGVFICISDLSERSTSSGSLEGKIGFIATSISRVACGIMSASGVFVLSDLLSNKLIVSAALPSVVSTNQNANSDELFPADIFHLTQVMCVARSISGSLVATGCNDGSVYVWKSSILPGNIKIEKINQFRVHSSAVLSLEFSVDSSLLMSSAADGSVMVTNVDKVRSLKKDPRQFTLKISEDSVRETIAWEIEHPVQDRLWSEINAEIIIESLREKFFPSIRVIADSIDTLKLRLGDILNNNEECDELEKMEDEEFVINTWGRSQIISETEKEAEKVRNYYEDECLKNELLAARLRATCWDINEVEARCILPILKYTEHSIAVWSFPIKKYTDEDIQRLDRLDLLFTKISSPNLTYENRIKRLRALEMRAQISHGGGLIQLVPCAKTRSAWITAVEGCPVSVAWLVNDGARWPCADVESMLASKEILELEIKLPGKDIGNSTATTAGAEDEDEATGAENDVTEHDVDFGNIFNLLYPPQAVRTQIQKKTQIILLKDVCRRIRSHFNVKFETVCHNKYDVMAAIDAINIRIHEILTELQIVEDVFAPTLADVEIANSAILVHDSELRSRPYISDAAIQKKKREDEERHKRELENSKDDSKGRALIDMMNGTLEVKRDVFAEASALQKPGWMEGLSYDMMTESQKKEADEYDIKFRLLQEEQMKYKKSLEIELKRLRSDIKDLCKDFDEKVEKLARSKIITEREILSHELYMSRLALGMANRDQLRKHLQQVETNIVAAESALKERQDNLIKFSETVQSTKDSMIRASEEEKNMMKTFPRDIRVKCDFQFDPETLKVLTHFFKYRNDFDDGGDGNEMDHTEQSNTFGFSSDNKKSSSMRGSKSSQFKGSRRKTKTSTHKSHSKSSAAKSKQGQGKSAAASQTAGVPGRLGPMQEAALAMAAAKEDLPAITLKDPFYNIILKQEREQRHTQQSQPSTEPLDIPGDLQIDQYFWSKLNELRIAHIQKQIEANTASVAYVSLKKKLDELVTDEVLLKENVRTLYYSRDEIIRSINTADKDLQCVAAIRQGQDEVDKDVIVTDYADSALIPTSVVNKFNYRIKELGQDKIGVLTKIKQFRRKINLLNWEARHAEIISKHLEEYLTDLQLFRVTRNMQQIIRDGDVDRNDKTGGHFDKSQKRDSSAFNSSFRADKILKGKRSLKRLLKTRLEENQQLEKRIDDLRVQINEHKSVLYSRREARGEDADPSVTAMKRMKKVVTQRRLHDMATMQTSELVRLHNELEIIREKTFPSFVKAFRSRFQTNPDDKNESYNEM